MLLRDIKTSAQCIYLSILNEILEVVRVIIRTEFAQDIIINDPHLFKIHHHTFFFLRRNGWHFTFASVFRNKIICRVDLQAAGAAGRHTISDRHLRTPLRRPRDWAALTCSAIVCPTWLALDRVGPHRPRECRRPPGRGPLGCPCIRWVLYLLFKYEMIRRVCMETRILVNYITSAKNITCAHVLESN